MLRIRHFLFLPVLTCFVISAQAQEVDAKGSQDHPLLTRMQNMYISVYKMTDFDQFAFRTGPKTTEPVEGKRFEIRYVTKTGFTPPTPISILRNHQQAIVKIGGSRYMRTSATRP